MMMKANIKYFLPALLMFSIFVSSCSTSNKFGDRSEKYSRARTRSNSDRTYKAKETIIVKTSPAKPTTKESAKPNVEMAGKRSSEMIERSEIVESAFKHIGVPYKSAGKTPDEGFDCSGFTNYVFTSNGYTVSGPSGKLASMGVYREQSQLKPGDLVFFGKETQVTHVGMVTNNTKDQTYFIHSSTSMGVKIDEINGSDYWRPKFLFGRDILFEAMNSKANESKASIK
jgi:cell wall-associated NlpC family hydrolase